MPRGLHLDVSCIIRRRSWFRESGQDTQLYPTLLYSRPGACKINF